MTTCRNIAAEVAKGRLSSEDVDDLVKRLERARDAMAGLDDIEGRLMEKGRIIASDIQMAAMIEKRNRLKNILIEGKIWSRIGQAENMVDDPSLGIESLLVGVNTPIEGAQLSIDAVGKALEGEWNGGMLLDMDRAGVLPQFNKMKGDLERDVGRALWDMSLKEPVGVKVSTDARTIAGILHKYQKLALRRENRAGAYIREAEGYVTRQSHRSDRIVRAGFEAWSNDIRGRLDFARMEVAPDQVDDFLASVYETVTTGIRMVDDVPPVEKAFKGPGNLARKQSAARVLLFKSADDFMAYDQKFGAASIREAFMSQMRAAARSAALMEGLGTNPAAMLDRVMQKAKRKYRSEPDKLRGIVDKTRRFNNQLAELDGSINFGSGSTIAQVGALVRAQQTVAKLGGSAVSALADITFGASNRLYHGRNITGAWADAFAAPFKGLRGTKKRDLARAMGVGFDGAIGTFNARFNAADTLPGIATKGLTTYFKFNLLTPWTDAVKRGMTLIVSADLGRAASKPFAALDPAHQRLLGIYGIDAKKWEVARAAVKRGDDGVDYILPGDIDGVRGAMFTGMTERQQQRLRDEVRESMFALLVGEADFSSPTPGAREHAVMRQGLTPDTASGQAIRFVGQFKSFGVTALTKVMGRQVYGTGAATLRDALARGVGGNLGIINTIVGGTVMGYFVLQAKQIIAGKDPKPNNIKTLVAAMMQGGGVGIYGDFLFGQYSRAGGGPLETLAGPVLTDAAELLELLQRARGVIEGGDVDFGGDVLRLLKSNTPFANLFYLKGAMDYLLWYHLQEMVNPGYLRRMESRIKRDTGQQYFLPPSTVVARGGGFR